MMDDARALLEGCVAEFGRGPWATVLPRRRTVHVMVEEPASDADAWCVRSDDLAEALGVASAVEAESLVLDALLTADADVEVDLDSSGNEFFAYAGDRAGVDAVLAAMARLGLSVATASC